MSRAALVVVLLCFAADAGAQTRPSRSGAGQRPAPTGERSAPTGGATADRARGGADAGAGAAAVAGRDAGSRDATAPRSSPAGLEAARSKVPAATPDAQASLESLKGRLGSLEGSAAAGDEVQQLAHDLQGMGLQKPDPALAEDLATSLQSALADTSLSPREMAELSQDVYALLNSAGLSQSEIEVLLADVESILAAAEVSPAEIQAILGDLQALAGTTGGSAQGASAPGDSRRQGPRRR